MATSQPTPHPKTIDYDETPPVELQISSEILSHLIDMARDFQVKEDVVEPDPGSNATDDKMTEVLEDDGEDDVEREMRQVIRDLNSDQRADLIALMWLGRGDFDISEWPAQRREAANFDRDVATYLIHTPLVADYWNEGMAALNRSVLDENPPVEDQITPPS